MSAGFVNVVITGASSGIGRALALNLAKRPAAAPVAGAQYRLLLLARREEELAKVAAEINGDGDVIAHVRKCDVTSEAEVAAAADHALALFGRVDVWINNAGRGITKNVLDTAAADVDDMVTVNVKSALYGMQQAVRVFKQQAGDAAATGHVVNVSSILGRNATLAPMRAAYSGAKHFLNALTDALRVDLQANDATKGIVVSTFSPGPVATDFGLNASGPDSRTFSGAQDVDECVEALRQQIEARTDEAYSRPQYGGDIAQFFASKNKQ